MEAAGRVELGKGRWAMGAAGSEGISIDSRTNQSQLIPPPPSLLSNRSLPFPVFPSPSPCPSPPLSILFKPKYLNPPKYFSIFSCGRRGL